MELDFLVPQRTRVAPAEHLDEPLPRGRLRDPVHQVREAHRQPRVDADAVGEEHVSTRASDKLVYATDWSWMPQMWLDRGEEAPSPDFIVHPASAEEIARVLQIANTYRVPVVTWGGGSGTQGGAIPIFGGIVPQEESHVDDIAQKKEWRIIYYVGTLAIAILDVFAKTTRETPDDVIRNCKRRLGDFRIKDKP